MVVNHTTASHTTPPTGCTLVSHSSLKPCEICASIAHTTTGRATSSGIVPSFGTAVARSVASASSPSGLGRLITHLCMSKIAEDCCYIEIVGVTTATVSAGGVTSLTV